MIYLDNHATTAVDPEVLRVMLPYFSTHFGNAASLHTFGEQAREAISQSKTALARLFGRRASEFVITSGATEAANLAIFGAAAAQPKRKHIIVSEIEHPAVLEPIASLEAQGYEVSRVGVTSDGQISPSEIASLIREDTLFVAIMLANNQTGVILPAAKIGAICREKETLFLCDACQAVGKIPVHISTIKADLLLLSAHKFHGPKGVGALYVGSRAAISPQILGSLQQNGKRAGTENVTGLVGMGMAAYSANAHLKDNLYQAVAEKRDRLEKAICESIPKTLVLGRNQSRLPGSLNVAFQHAASEVILQLLDERGIAVSSSSACKQNEIQPSHVLRAMKLEETYLHGSIRFGLSRHTTEIELDKLMLVLPKIVSVARRSSPFWKEI